MNRIANNILRILIITGTVLIVTIFCPRRESFHYAYSTGSTWKYETLRSPFSFPILKPSQELEKEKNSIIESSLAVFRKIPGVGPDVIRSVDYIEFDTSLAGLEDGIKEIIIRELNEIYYYGVIKENEIENIKGRDIFIIDGENLIQIPTARVFTLQSATVRIEKALSTRYPFLESDMPEINISVDLSYDADITEKMMLEQLDKISPYAGVFQENNIIINEGEIITNDKHNLLDSYRSAFINQVGDRSTHILTLISYFVMVLIIISIIIIYILYNKKDIYNKPGILLFLLMWIIIFSYAVYILDPLGLRYLYAIPFVIAPIVVINFFDKNLALAVHIAVVLIASLISSAGYEFTIIQLIAGIFAVMLFAELRFWNKFFKNIFIILAVYVISFISLSLINTGSINSINWLVLLSFVFNSLLILLAYPLIPLLEKPFGFVSVITLTELGDFNKTLLRELALKASGTMQHSIQVGILAEAAVKKIGGNSLLVKTGALYHDIGKMKAPEYFIENQREGENPYEGLDNFKSAARIIEHVTEGNKMAKQAGLPKILKRFILTHHGDTRVEFFYRKQVNESEGKDFDESLFRYPGPKPQSKEETVFMLADSLEASAKSIRNPSEKDIDDLVENITKQKIDDGQFCESDLSFSELLAVKRSFRESLKSMYHSRIKYPDIKAANVAKSD